MSRKTTASMFTFGAMFFGGTALITRVAEDFSVWRVLSVVAFFGLSMGAGVANFAHGMERGRAMVHEVWGLPRDEGAISLRVAVAVAVGVCVLAAVVLAALAIGHADVSPGARYGQWAFLAVVVAIVLAFVGAATWGNDEGDE